MMFKIYIKKFVRIFLKFLFKFDWWHTSPIENRKYAMDVIKLVNKHETKNVVLEIGCGLGDIISKLDFKNRLFYDYSKNAINAAKFMQLFRNIKHKSKDFFEVFDIFSDKIDESIECNVVIMVNWIHAYDSSLLAPKIDNLIKNNMHPRGLIIFDIVSDKNNNPFSNKTFHHKIGDLINEKDFEIKIIDGYRFGRSLVFARLL